MGLSCRQGGNIANGLRSRKLSGERRRDHLPLRRLKLPQDLRELVRERLWVGTDTRDSFAA